MVGVIINKDEFSIPDKTLKLLFLSKEDIQKWQFVSYNQNEPSTIYLKLPVEKPMNPDCTPRPYYYPTYLEMNPQQRWIYLNWLENVTNPINIGYVFVYYYGLERHLLFGEFDLAFNEILFLRKHNNHSSFMSYSNTALIYSCILRNRTDCLKRLFDTVTLRDLGNLGLFGAHLLGVDLSMEGLLDISTKVQGINRKYVDLKPDLFKEVLIQCLEAKYGACCFPIRSYRVQDLPKKREIIFANFSFAHGERVQEVADFYGYPPFIEEIRFIFAQTHESVKARLKTSRGQTGKKHKKVERAQKNTFGGQIPKRVTSNWIISLSDRELISIEKQLYEEIQRIKKERVSQMYPDEDGIIRISVKGDTLAAQNTLYRRRDRICEEMKRRALQVSDEKKLPVLPPLPVYSWLRRLTDDQLIEIEQQVVDLLIHLDEKERKIYRIKPQPADRYYIVKSLEEDRYRFGLFWWFIWLDLMQRDHLPKVVIPKHVNPEWFDSLSDFEQRVAFFRLYSEKIRIERVEKTVMVYDHRYNLWKTKPTCVDSSFRMAYHSMLRRGFSPSIGTAFAYRLPDAHDYRNGFAEYRLKKLLLSENRLLDFMKESHLNREMEEALDEVKDHLISNAIQVWSRQLLSDGTCVVRDEIDRMREKLNKKIDTVVTSAVDYLSEEAISLKEPRQIKEEIYKFLKERNFSVNL